MNAQGKTRTVSYRDFEVGPETDVTRETDIRNGGVLTAALLPALRAGVRSVLPKQGENPLDESVAKVAVMLDRVPDGCCQHTSIGLGEPGPVPLACCSDRIGACRTTDRHTCGATTSREFSARTLPDPGGEDLIPDEPPEKRWVR